MRRREVLLALAGGVAAGCGFNRVSDVTPGVTLEPTAVTRVRPDVTLQPKTVTAVTLAVTLESQTVTSMTPGVTPPVTLAAPAQTVAPVARQRVLAGVDVLLGQRIDLLRGRKLGLVTNPTGRDAQGRATIDALRPSPAPRAPATARPAQQAAQPTARPAQQAAQPTWRLVALFSPEHGIRGDAAAGVAIDSATDAATGSPVYSLYVETTRPTAQMLQGIDMLVFDIQDVGARVYTYISTLLEVMRAAAEHAIPVVVLDRPDPLGGQEVEGNVLDPRFASFVGPAPLAMRYGLTIGELARLFNAELQIGADLTVVPLQNWSRDMWYDETGLAWVNPSPNLRSLAAATLYAGTVLVEGTTLSEGRGTDRPFEWLGAPWIDGAAWATRLTALGLPGVRFEAASQTPDTSKYAGLTCQGVLVSVDNKREVQAMALGVHLLASARDLAPEHFQITATNFDKLAGTDQLRQALQQGRPASEIVASWQPDLQRFRRTRAQYLLY